MKKIAVVCSGWHFPLHFYENISTHYVNIAYEYEIEEIPDLPNEQHSEHYGLVLKGY